MTLWHRIAAWLRAPLPWQWGLACSVILYGAAALVVLWLALDVVRVAP